MKRPLNAFLRTFSHIVGLQPNHNAHNTRGGRCNSAALLRKVANLPLFLLSKFNYV